MALREQSRDVSRRKCLSRLVTNLKPRVAWREKYPAFAKAIWVGERSVSGFVIAALMWAHPYEQEASVKINNFYSQHHRQINTALALYSAGIIVREGARIGVDWCKSENPMHAKAEKAVLHFLTDWDALAIDLFGPSDSGSGNLGPTGRAVATTVAAASAVSIKLR